MKSKFIGREKNEVTFQIEFTAEDFDAATQKAYLKERGKIAIDGFRKGKAPRSIIEKKYGEAVFFETAVDDLLQENYSAALDELKIDAVDRPSDVNLGDEKLEKGKGFTVTIKVTVSPEVELKKYIGLEAEVEVKKVTAKDVDAELKNMQQKNARLIDTEDAAEKGDTVLIDYAGFFGEEQFSGGTAEGYSLKLGSDTFIPGFEDQLIGVKAGEDKDVTVTFPEDYQAAEYAGREAVFKCKVHSVKKEELPELDDEFAKDVSEFDTLKELKADVKKNLEKTAKEQADYVGKNLILEKLIEENPVEVPQVMIADEVNQMYEEYVQRLSYQGVSPEAAKKYLKDSEMRIKENLMPEATKRVQGTLLVTAVAAKEGIAATEEELENEFNEMAKEYGMEVEQVKKALTGSVEYIKEDLAYRKAIDFLYEKANITAPKKAEKAQKEEKAEDAKTEKKPAAKKTTKKAENKEE